jgi:tetratricopeptide (TPR) repeat protein
MRKSQIIIVIIAIMAVISLFYLPKYLVKDEREQAKVEKIGNTPHSEVPETSHQMEIPEDQLNKINLLRKSYFSVLEKEKKLKFADSLAILFRNVNKYDSSARYLEEIAILDPTRKNVIKAGDAYFDAATFALNEEKSSDLAEKARALFEKAFEEDKNNLEVKTKLAKTYFGSHDPQNTMKGVKMLKEVISVDPGNEESLFNLGTLSIQSKQYDKAVERFEAIVQKNPSHIEGLFWLGYSYMMMGEKGKAKDAFKKAKKLSKDPQVLATVDNYLKELK